jgi:hypothetical protein
MESKKLRFILFLGMSLLLFCQEVIETTKNQDQKYLNRTEALMSFFYETEIEAFKSDKKVLNIFDFDGTLFKSPLPNRLIFTSQAAGRVMSDCGWFWEPATLAHPYIPLYPDSGSFSFNE